MHREFSQFIKIRFCPYVRVIEWLCITRIPAKIKYIQLMFVLSWDDYIFILQHRLLAGMVCTPVSRCLDFVRTTPYELQIDCSLMLLTYYTPFLNDE